MPDGFRDEFKVYNCTISCFICKIYIMAVHNGNLKLWGFREPNYFKYSELNSNECCCDGLKNMVVVYNFYGFEEQEISVLPIFL